MDLDELFTPKKAPAGFPRNLEPLGIEQLEAYKQELKKEDARIDAEIARKKKQRELADSLFKK
jgi:uncharacterized small protein (DUF1192 family)